ncbi:MAG: DUF5777 family beta-barrel protein [Acidobacteriota bacterium]
MGKPRGGALLLAFLLACGAALAQEPAPTERVRPPEGSRIINLPSADVPAKGTLGVLFSHRFAQPLDESDYQSFFSFDSGADIGLGLSYSPLDSLELSLDRSSAQDDYELAAKYRFLPFAEGRPFALSLRVGGNARTEEGIEDRTAYFAQGIASVALGSRVRLTAIPTFVSNTPLFRNVFTVPVALSVAVTRTVNLQAEFYPKNGDFTELPATATAPPRRTSAGWIVAFEKTVLRHRFSWTVGNLRATSVDQYAGSDFAGGIPRNDVFIGFNLVRQWKLK